MPLLDDADLVVDLSRVEFMGAATVSVIIRAHEFFIRAHEFLRQQSRSLALRSASNAARRVLDLCGLVAMLDP